MRWESHRSVISNCGRRHVRSHAVCVRRTSSPRSSADCCCACSLRPIPAWTMLRQLASTQHDARHPLARARSGVRPIVTPDALLTALEAFRPRDPSAALSGLLCTLEPHDRSQSPRAMGRQGGTAGPARAEPWRRDGAHRHSRFASIGYSSDAGTCLWRLRACVLSARVRVAMGIASASAARRADHTFADSADASSRTTAPAGPAAAPESSPTEIEIAPPPEPLPIADGACSCPTPARCRQDRQAAVLAVVRPVHECDRLPRGPRTDGAPAGVVE